MYLINN